MRLVNRGFAALAAIAVTAALTTVVSIAPAGADTVNDPPIRSINGPTTGLGSLSSSVHTTEGTWVVSYSGPTALRLFSPNANGNAAPIRSIAGANTGLTYPWDVTTDAADNLYVADYLSNSIRIFTANASGNVFAARVISGAATQLSRPTGIDLDAQGNIYVANYSSNQINVYAPNASGNATPVRVIGGLATKLSQPTHLRLVAGRLWVPNLGDSSVLAFDKDATGNMLPLSQLKGPATTLSTVWGVALDPRGNIYVANAAKVDMFAPNATGDVAPRRTLAGTATTLTSAISIDLDSDWNLRVADAGGACLTFAPLAGPTPPPAARAPGKVRSLKVHGSKRAARRSVTWRSPSSNGGRPITGYRVSVRKGGKVLLTRKVTGTRTVLKKRQLRQGTLQVSVSARNSVGSGAATKVRFKVRR